MFGVYVLQLVANMDWNIGSRVQYLQAQLFPVCTISTQGFLGSFLSKSLKTNQLEVNTDERTLRPIARLKEPRDLFALPKDKDHHDCPQQTARWPSECQVLDERVCHIEFVPEQPEPYYQPTGNELRPRPVGEENGVVVYNYNPVSAVNYKTEDSDSDSSSDSRSPSPDVHGKNRGKRFTAIFVRRSSSKSNEEELDDDDCKDMLQYLDEKPIKIKEAIQRIEFPKAQKVVYKDLNNNITEPDSDGDSDSDGDDDKNNINNTTDKNNNNSTFENVDDNFNNEEYSSELDENLKDEVFNKTSLQFSRSSVGGSKFLMNVQPYLTNLNEDTQDLEFESRFESGNLAKAVKITSTYYELYLRPDLYTNRHKQWFYFRVTNTRRNIIYRFSIVNLVKSDSLYNEGMRPLMYSTINASVVGEGWKRCGDNICYYKNDDEASSDEDEDNGSYTLTFNIQFPNDADTVYFAHSYPYTYSDLQDYLMEIQRHPVKSKFCKLRLLCRSLAGNNVYYLTVTAPTTDEDANKKKRAIVVSARVHPGETPSSWMMKGLMDFITGDSYVAKRLRHKFIFKLIPMLNPDGVIVGNTRSSLTGKDLNRQYRTVIRETYPSIWYTKAMIKRLIDDGGVSGVAMYCDMHAHSRKHNIFIYGCENKRTPDKKLSEQVFPLMLHKNCADKFSFESCKFRVQRSKEGTGRIVVWMLGVTNSYTIEASFGGSTMGSRNGTHFSTADYEHMGRAFCETLLDYYDDNPVKERLRSKIIERLTKEGSSADEPLNIPLSDYSSDEGDTSSSSSDNEGKSAKYSDLEGPCCHPLKVPPCSPVFDLSQRKDDRKGKIFKRRKRKFVRFRSEEFMIEVTRKRLLKITRKRKFSRKDKNKKSMRQAKKVRAKIKSANVNRRAKRSERAVLDLPTTDPGSDIQFTSDDEIHADADGFITTMSRSTRKPDLLLNNYQTIDCTTNEAIVEKMPPELIVTPAKHKKQPGYDPLRKSGDDKNSKKSPTFNGVTEFPPIEGNHTARRTHSWHNLNTKSVPKIRGNSLQNAETTVENLQLKLSLKKQIWTGVSPDGSSIDKNRPLSWGIPPILKTKSAFRDDSEALLTACSQKLAEWQESELGGSARKNKVTINLVVPNVAEKTPKMKKPIVVKPQIGRSDIITKASDQSNKKRRNPLSKITETSQILSRLTKSKVKTTQITQRKYSQPITPGVLASTTTSVSIMPSLASTTKRHHKFKTGGIVATAAQPIKKKKVRSLPLSTTKLKLNSDISSDSDSEKPPFLRKVKTKIRKRKNKNSI